MKRTVSIKWAACLLLHVSSVAADFTWWVDSSCDKVFPPGVFDKMMAEVPQTAQMVWDRASRSKDEEPQAHEAYNTLFHYEPAPRDMLNFVLWKRFTAIVGTIVKFTKEPASGDDGRKNSELRIYCDNDKRMKLVEDDKTVFPNVPEDTPLNSQRKPEDQEWEDTINKVNVLGQPSCLYNNVRTDNKFTAACTLGMVKKQEVEGEHLNRVSVTICDYWLEIAGRINTWEEANLPGKTFPDDLPGFLDGTAVDALEYIGSQVMYHELMHLTQNARVDNAYGIKNCLALDTASASMNAESHAMYGGLVRAMEYKQKLGGPTFANGDLVPDSTIRDRVPAELPLKVKRTPVLTCEDRTDNGISKESACKEFAA